MTKKKTVDMPDVKLGAFPFQIEVTNPKAFVDGKLNQFHKGTPESAGYDLVAWPDEPVVLKAGECKPISLGVKLWINQPGVFGLVAPRSGLGAKKGLVIGNTIGVIDSDYQGEAMVFAYNRNHRAVNLADRQVITINPGDRIAQILFVPVLAPEFAIVPKFELATIRGNGGFGSSGLNVADLPKL